MLIIRNILLGSTTNTCIAGMQEALNLHHQVIMIMLYSKILLMLFELRKVSGLIKIK